MLASGTSHWYRALGVMQCSFVVPAKAGTQCLSALKSLGPGIRRGDEHEVNGLVEIRR